MAFGAIGAGLASSFAAKARQREAAAAQLHLFKRRHQFETEDLEKAGLNRILGFARSSAPGVSAPGIAQANFPVPDLLGIPKKLAGAKISGGLAKAALSTAEAGVTTAKEGARASKALADEREHIATAAKYLPMSGMYGAMMKGEQANQARAEKLLSWQREKVGEAGIKRDLERAATEGKYEAGWIGKALRAWSMGFRHVVGPANLSGQVSPQGKRKGLTIINQRR